MTQVSAYVREYGVKDLAQHGHEKARRGFAAGLRSALILISKHHTRKEMIRGWSKSVPRKERGRLSSGRDRLPVDPYRITVRTGALARSYMIDTALLHQLIGAYGSNLVYAPVHEFGSAKKNIRPRPGVANTMKAVDSHIEKILADATRAGIDGK